MIRLLNEDEIERDYIWYAELSKSHLNNADITFWMWNPTDWKRYEANFAANGKTIYFDYDAIEEGYNNIDVLRSMINFIDSEDYKNFRFEEEYRTYVFEI